MNFFKRKKDKEPVETGADAPDGNQSEYPGIIDEDNAGAPMETSAEGAEGEFQAFQSVPLTPPKKSKKAVFAVIVFLLMITILFGVGTFFMLGGKKSARRMAKNPSNINLSLNEVSQEVSQSAAPAQPAPTAPDQKQLGQVPQTSSPTQPQAPVPPVQAPKQQEKPKEMTIKEAKRLAEEKARQEKAEKENQQKEKEKKEKESQTDLKKGNPFKAVFLQKFEATEGKAVGDRSKSGKDTKGKSKKDAEQDLNAMIKQLNVAPPAPPPPPKKTPSVVVYGIMHIGEQRYALTSLGKLSFPGDINGVQIKEIKDNGVLFETGFVPLTDGKKQAEIR